jgi:serine/threonine protein kinase
MTEIAGRYTLEAEVGRGGMGAVWRGRDEVLGRTVALKRIGVAPGGITPDAIRAEREAKLAAKLNHANVVAVFDLVEQDASDGLSQQWLVMEYVEGTDLAELISTRGRLTPDEAAPILAQTASALAAAHGAGIVHRDVKPSNILVAPDGQVKLSDFGIARTAADPSLTQTGLVTGSPAYMSPEVASGQQATPASDVWSWGATLFHALEGHPPYQIGDNLLGALYRIVHEEPPRAQAAGWLAPALTATMTRDAGQRWSMAQVQDFLEAGPQSPSTAATGGGLADLGFTEPVRTRSYDDVGSTQVLPLATTTAPPPAPPAPVEGPDSDPQRRRPWPLVVGAVLAVLVAMAIAFAIGLRDGGGDDKSGGRTGPSASTSTSGSAGPSSSAGATEDGMTSFIRDYIDTAVSDPASAFDMLTPEFQQESHGLEGYESFWGDVRSAKILSVSADPKTLEVSYRYRYVKPGGPTVDDVTLQLSYQDGRYLIAGEH